MHYFLSNLGKLINCNRVAKALMFCSATARPPLSAQPCKLVWGVQEPGREHSQDSQLELTGKIFRAIQHHSQWLNGVFLQNSHCLKSTWTSDCWWNLTAFTLLFASLLPKWLYFKPQGGLSHIPLPFWLSPIFHCGGISKWLAVALQQWQIGELQINLVTKPACFFDTSDVYHTITLSTLKGVHFLKAPLRIGRKDAYRDKLCRKKAGLSEI